jgi:hypothetical protein
VEEHIGKKYNYNGQNIVIEEIKEVFGKTVILTDKRAFSFVNDVQEKFFNKLKPYKEKKVFKMSSVQETTPIKEYQSDDEIKNILFDAITRVQNDAGFVKQANAICNITSQLISIKKLELLNK